MNEPLIYKRVSLSIAWLCVVLCVCMPASAQVKDTLRQVEISEKRVQKDMVTDLRISTYSPGQAITTIDSLTLAQYRYQDMANLLSQQVPVFVRSFGVNSVATLNFRGSSAAQSAVYWNGVPIQNAALGVADVSLLPVQLMNKVNVVYGSSSALLGSGNVGGALMVENTLPDFTSQLAHSQSVSAVVGSFNHYRAGLKSSLRSDRYSVELNAFAQSAMNDFGYDDASGAHTKMLNASLRSGVGLLQAAYKVDRQNIVSGRIWYQQYYREIPPALFETGSVKNQRDESLRGLLDWQFDAGRLKGYVKTSFIRDNITFQDSAVLVRSQYSTSQSYTEGGIDFMIRSRHRLLLFAPIQLSWMDRVTFGDRYSQNRYALAGAYLYQPVQKIEISFNSRTEIIDSARIFLPGLNASYDIKHWCTIRANVQRTYRVPTLNELYFVPGGNAALKPERGWAEELGYTMKWRHRPKYLDSIVLLEVDVASRQSYYPQPLWQVQHSLNIFNRNISDWIIWLGGAIWTPHNIASVWSRGVQTENSLERVLGRITLRFGLNAGYTLATTTQSYLPGDGSIGKQIPYTPGYNGQLNMGIRMQRWFVNYNQAYTGLRYITTDESFFLPAYTTGNVQAGYTFFQESHPLTLTAQCNNIWNSRYVVVNARPMPGINWLLGAAFTLDNYR